jgi:DNA-binding NarL/FixJ family response regulator
MGEVALTKKEKQIVDYIVKLNLSIEEIAKNMELTPVTIQAHIGTIYRVCGIDVVRGYKRTELVKQINDGVLIITDKTST